ncbi:MAG: spore coat protein CotJB [Clostridia bacterium]|nr:spore coat protein CotJB [Clostridia bacterium]
MNGNRDIRTDLDAVSFSLLDIMMYLDTHPDDAEALGAKAKYEEACARLRKIYEEKYGPLTASASGNGDCWEWIADPWPWEER